MESPHAFVPPLPVSVARWPPWVLAADSGNPAEFRRFNDIVPYQRKKLNNAKPGEIRVLKIYTRFARVSDPALRNWPEVPGYERFNVCKNNLYQDLSPMKLGTVLDEEGKLYAYTIEDGWQCSKVWPFHVEQSSVEHPPRPGEEPWMPLWKEWSRRGRFSNRSLRHRTPQKFGQQTDAKNKNIPLFSYYMGEKLSYRAARARMYMPWYAKLVEKTPAYQDLKNRHLDGQNLLLLEYDGLDRNNPEENRPLDEAMLKRLMDDPSRPFGHGLVLACCLLDLPLWEEYVEGEWSKEEKQE